MIGKMRAGIKDYAYIVKFRECEKKYDQQFEGYFEDIAKLKEVHFPDDFKKPANIINGEVIMQRNHDMDEPDNLGFGSSVFTATTMLDVVHLKPTGSK